MMNRGESNPVKGAQRHAIVRAVLCSLLGFGVLLALPGCGGCRKKPAETIEERQKRLAKELEKKKKKPNFESLEGTEQPPRLTTRPGNRSRSQRFQAAYKPGHWTSTTLSIRANNFDFVGNLEIATTGPDGSRVPLPNTEFDLTTSRQVALPKRQPRIIESVLFVPPCQRPPGIWWQLNWRGGNRRAFEVRNEPLGRMPSYQYHFLVLSRWPQYGYLNGLPAIKPTSNSLDVGPSEAYYRVALLGNRRRPLLPAHGLLWTSIACVLWDDADPDYLTLDQQQALLDWLHWGGQLILSGPDTLDTLRDSFLGPYLPATSSGSRPLGADDFLPLSQWSNGAKAKATSPLVPAQALAGVKFEPHPQAAFIPGSGELLIERQIGRGRVVATAFRLSDRDVTTWAGLDELLNAFLLRRPGRKFTDHVEFGRQAQWADGRHRLDASRISRLRYFARDTGVPFSEYGADVFGHNPDDFLSDTPAGTGMAGWNDRSLVANLARDTLVNAAQIEIPDRRFVLWVIVGYLAVLVPANWLVFRLLGRVEWAWAAAPVIAVACTAIVIRAAQLDIGFARSNTEITLLELQNGYSRGHVTRYTALYTALTTRYDLHFDDPGAQVQPFPKSAEPAEFSGYRRLLYSHGKGAGLLGQHVRSNSTGLVHSEQMCDLDGALSLRTSADGKFRLVNNTGLTLHDAVAVGRTESGDLESAFLGTLVPGASVPLTMKPQSPPAKGTLLWEDLHEDPTLTGADLEPGSLNLRRLMLLAQDQHTGDQTLQSGGIRPGEIRLIAGMMQEIPGLTIQPAAPQTQRGGLVLAHLKLGPGPAPQPDVNTRTTPEEISSPDPDDLGKWEGSVGMVSRMALATGPLEYTLPRQNRRLAPNGAYF